MRTPKTACALSAARWRCQLDARQRRAESDAAAERASVIARVTVWLDAAQLRAEPSARARRKARWRIHCAALDHGPSIDGTVSGRRNGLARALIVGSFQSEFQKRSFVITITAITTNSRDCARAVVFF